jgi:hypothetical protein
MSSLTDFGATVEAEHPADQCEAFRANGERCPYVQESDSKYCPDCSPATALLTFDDLGSTEVIGRDGRRYRRFNQPGVRDLLRDEYGFSPREAVALAGASVLSTAFTIEGRLVGAQLSGQGEIPTRAESMSCERARDLHRKLRENATSSTLIEKWRGACYIVEWGEYRCSSQRRTAHRCRWHHERKGDFEEKARIYEFDVPFGPDIGEC